MAQVSGCTTWGTFGPILSTVILDASHGKIIWSHWEDGSAGPIAIFRYQVSEEASHYDVSTERFANEGQDDLISHRTAYHGEIGVNAPNRSDPEVDYSGGPDFPLRTSRHHGRIWPSRYRWEAIHVSFAQCLNLYGTPFGFLWPSWVWRWRDA